MIERNIKYTFAINPFNISPTVKLNYYVLRFLIKKKEINNSQGIGANDYFLVNLGIQ